MNRAKETKDNGLCKSVSKHQRSRCYSSVAVAKDDLNACKHLQKLKYDSNADAIKWFCILQIASKKHDRKLCNQIKEKQTLDLCLAANPVAIEGDPCSRISKLMRGCGGVGSIDVGLNDGCRDNCYLKRAFELQDPKVCDDVSEAERFGCLSDVAVAKDDVEMCMNLPVPDSIMPRWDCYVRIARKRKNPKMCDKVPPALNDYCRGK